MAAPQTPSTPANPAALKPAPLKVDRTIALFERPAMGIADQPTFDAVKQAIETRFSPAAVEAFLKSLERSSLRIRDFEAVLEANKLGSAAPALYSRLAGGDQGQIREFYLASLERVDLSLRDKFFKLYAYY